MAIDDSASAFSSPWPDRLRHSAIVLLVAGLSLSAVVIFGELPVVRAVVIFACIAAALKTYGSLGALFGTAIVKPIRTSVFPSRDSSIP